MAGGNFITVFARSISGVYPDMIIRNLFMGLVLLASCSVALGQDSYRCVDDGLRLDVIHSDPKAFYISMDMDPRGNLYVGGRDAVYLFEADGKGGFKARKTITKLPPHTWAYSLQVAGDDLYVLTVTALYRLPNVIRDPGKVTFERLVWGIPLGHIHQGFHGMRMGPDGQLLLAFGDPHPGPFRSRTNPGHVWHWTFLSGPGSKEGASVKKLPWTGVGGVIRYDPKSHDLHVVSRGFRNICDLAIDEHWNMFGNDNDQEGSALHTLGRLVHVTDGSHYQWSRGWLSAVEPHRNDLITTLVADVGRFVPFGTCYYNEDHLGKAYKRSLFVARWGSRELGQFPLTERGASFRSRQKTLIAGKGTARPVAVSTGNDGRLFMSVCFMERNEASPVRRTDLVMISNPKRAWKSNAYDSSDGIDRLLTEVESSSWRRRFNAHREIIARGQVENIKVVERFLKCAPTNPAWQSLAWLAGRSKDARVTTALNEALRASDARVVAVAADILNRFHQLDEEQIKDLLAHGSPVVQLAGLRNIASDDRAKFTKTIAVLASSKDSHVRQLAMRMLGQARSFEQLEQQFNDGDLPARRVALSAAMWKWVDTVENGFVPKEVKLSPAQTKHLSGFSYVDDSKSNLLTESKKHGFPVGGLSLMDWWRQTSASNAAAPIMQRMITKAIDDKDNNQRKTAGVFANTLGLNELAKRVPGLMQTRPAKAKLVKGAKLSANKAMPAAYQKTDWSNAWKKGEAKTGAKLFKERCAACHDSGQGGGVIGPSLAGVAARFKPQYLAESVAVPSKDISPNFQAWSVTLKSGDPFEEDPVLLGLIAGQNDQQLTLQLMDGTLKFISKSDIKHQAVSTTSLMPVGLIKGPDELKHLVKYLMTLKASTPGSDATASSGISTNLLADGDLKRHFQTTGNWTLSKDGVAHLQPRPGETDWKRYGAYLWFKEQYKNFECEFEYSHEKGGNSGFYFNVSNRQKAVGSVIEVQIKDSFGETKLDAHGISGGILPGIAPKANAAKPAGQWNYMTVKSLDGEVTVTLNGKLVNQVKLSHARLKGKPKQGYIGFQDHGLPFSLRNIRIRRLSSTPSAPVVRDDPSAVEVFRKFKSLKANEFRFAPVEARFVRVNVLESNRGQPCVDELEIFSSGSSKNIALQSNGAKASASSLLKGYSKHKIEFLNDGRYGNLRSWIPAEKTGWAQIELSQSTKIDRVVLSRDRGGQLTRRVPIAFDILVSSDGKEWKTVKKVRPPKAGAASNAPAPNRKKPVAVAPRAEKIALSAKASLPNIVLILADDFGWGDASCNNPVSPLKTPAIDRIAKEGIRFTNAHTSSAVCTPTRYGLLTGRYPWRSYLKKEVLAYYAPALITADQTTVASYLKSQGYRTAGFGKWHLGLDWTPVKGDPMKWRSHWNTRDVRVAAKVAKGIDHTKPFRNSPIDIGFDTYFGTPSNCSRMPFFIEDNRVAGNPQRSKNGMLRDPACARDKVDDIYVAKAIGFMEAHEKQHADRPFFIYLPLNAIHGAVTVPQRFTGRNGMTKREDKILWANESVGKILAALDRMKLTDDTLLIFTTDNGPINSPTAREKGHQPTGPYRGLKTTVWDGGTRVPFVARWPRHIPVGATTDQLIGLTDMLATFAALCGSPLPKGAGPDSVNQLPVLLQQKDDIVQRPALVTASYAGFLTIRDDEWKAVFGTKWTGGHPGNNYGGPSPKGTPPDDPDIGQLFNIADDPFEEKDLWDSHPDVVKKLRDELQVIKQKDKTDNLSGVNSKDVSAKPNVVLIFSDDMGYSDLPKFGKSEIPTPGIDRLANEGVLFTDAYVTAPICVASRMGLMTGQYQQRFGIYGNIYGEDKTRLFRQQTLMSQVFQKAGYHTAHVGKWHLSGNKRMQYETAGPRERGFDESVAIRGGDSAFWKGTPVFRNGKQFPAPEYLTDFWGTEACAFIDRNRSRPFFLYLAFNAVHSPMHALDADQEKFPDVKDNNRRIYDGMLLSMDRSIGRVLDRLDRHGIADNTIVIFLNDNGGGESTARYAGHSRNYANNKPLRGFKFDLFEGGVRVPMILRWPGRVPKGKVYREMVSSMDVYPTLVGAAGLQMPKGQPTDGIDLLPFVKGDNKTKPHEWLCWQNRSWLPRKKGGSVTPTPKVHNSAIRKGNWKLVRLNEKIGADTPPPDWRLYDLTKDIGEQNDVAGQNTDVVNELGAHFATWRSSMHPTVE